MPSPPDPHDDSPVVCAYIAGEDHRAIRATHEAYPNRFSSLKLIDSWPEVSTLVGSERVSGARRLVSVLDYSEISHGKRMRLDRDSIYLKRVRSDAVAGLVAWEAWADYRVAVFSHTEGDTLEAVLAGHRLGVEQTLELAVRILDGLDALHEHKITHGDLNPHCVTLVDGEAASAVLHGAGAPPPTSNVSEDPRALLHALYCSPEAAGAIEYDTGPWSDLYSLGILLFRAVAGVPPFRAEDIGQILFEHVTAPIPSLESFGVEDAPSAFEAFLGHLLKKDPRDRYQTAASAMADANRLVAALRAGDTEPQIEIDASAQRCRIAEPAFVGRQRELQALLEAVEDAKRGAGGAVLLEAPSGGGKSRMHSELMQIARRESVWVLTGQETNDNGRRNLTMLNGVVADIVSLASRQPEVASQFTSSLRRESTTLTSVLPNLEPLLGDHEHVSAPEEFGETRAVRALIALLDALGAAERPALVFLDDCQWADAMSLKLLQQWSRAQPEGGRYVTVVVAFRSEEAAPDHPLRRVAAMRQIKLDPLDEAEIRQLAESMAGELPEEILELTVRLAEGSPFMASAVLRGLNESGALVAGSKGWLVDRQKLDDCQSSDQAAKLLSRRVDLMSEPAIRLLSIGAVLGKEFDVSLTARLMGVEPEAFVEALDEAKERRLVWVRPDRTHCVFVHDKVRAAALERLDDTTARTVHRQAAVLLCGHPGSSTAEIAHHFDACGDSHAALHFAMTAAVHARKRYALDVAEDQYRITLRGVPDDDRVTKCRINEGLGEVLMLKGKYDEAFACFTRATPLANGKHSQASIRGKLAELSLKRGEMELAASEYESALRRLGYFVPRHALMCVLLLAWQGLVQLAHTLAPRIFLHRKQRLPDASERLRLQLLSGLSHSCWYGRSRTKMFWSHLAGMNRAERYQPSAELADAYSNHGVGMSLFALTGRAETYCQKALDTYAALSDAWGQGKTLHYWGIVLYGASRFQECIEKCRESVRLLERMGDYQQMHLARYQIAASHYHLGDFFNAIEQAKLNRQSGLVTGDTQAAGINLEIWARSTNGDMPRDLIEEEFNRDRFDPQGAAQVTLANAVVLLRDAREEEAIAIMRDALHSTHGRGVKNFYTMPLLAWVATASRSLAERCSPYDAHRLRRLLKQTLADARRGLLQSWACRNDAPRMLREAAVASAMLGRPVRAKHKLYAALHIAKKQRARFEFALCLQAYGKIGEPLGWDKASARLASAQRTLDLLAFRARGDQASEADTGRESLSLVDRFDTVLESGRSIASSLGSEAIYQQTQRAALRLLRGQECVVWDADASRVQVQTHVSSPEQVRTLQIEHYRDLIDEGSCWGPQLAPVFSADGVESDHGSCLAAPILVRGRITAIMVVAHRDLDNLFGEDELRLAEFIATIAGAALENAAGFQQLQELNATLEARVSERTAVAEGKARELAESNQELLRVATELREKEEQLRVAMQAAEAASEAKSQFLATMSHEIRTPMNGILGMAELALRSELTPQLSTYLQTVKQSGEALLMLLNDVLDFSKIEAGKMEIEEIEFDLRAVVRDAVKLMSAAAGKKGVELLFQVAPRAPKLILGDPNRLRQIIVNLVGNAVKFTDEGEVVVSAEAAPKLGRGWVLRFSVRDTGPGVPAEKQNEIFEAFRQSDGSTTRKYGGTGLGLSISTELVGLMGGRIWLESEVGQGSTFFFEIPLRTDAAATPPAEPERRLEGVHAMVVSDCQSGADLYARTLERHGASVSQVGPETDLAAAAGAAPGERRLAVVDLSNRGNWGPELAGRWPSLSREHDWETLWLTPVDWVDTPDHQLQGVRITKPLADGDLIASAIQALRLMTAVEAAEPEDESIDSRPLKILLVDDSQVNQQVGAGLLATQGHKITTADNGAEALQELAAADFDIVLMDLEMPVMDGLQATRKIRERDAQRGAHTPVVAMTAHALHVVREKCEQAQMDACLTKPIDPRVLFEELARLVPSGVEA
ncbi:Signal transduction histidine-protein kinase BarA [Posidoniimonas polymericola]|uniref:histidine kinase n=1 Tax=Posidoniimonas polymericola TaxID=2528002 RepID=A0A5C5YQV1_9BACT|nr:ATP-binding protein [Posidoniimonas polymericola]TWT77130.1 Signal transduction histidine-protein kinase BarA [Posidoniimonas polymericola]